MGNNVRNELMDLNLNLVPVESHDDPIPELGSLLIELETAHGRIEERIRQLEAITSRFSQHQRWRTVNTSVETMEPNVEDEVRPVDRESGSVIQEGSVNKGHFGKRAGAQLIAKALGMETDVKNEWNNCGDFFDCNICLDMARDPVLTCCGHLFCWACYYQLSYAHSDVKECPACEGEVKDTSIIPIYGNGNNINTCKSKSKESALGVPPRPPAHRIESIRQQFISRRSFSSTQERIQLFRNIISARGVRSQSVEVTGAERTGTSHILPSMEAEGNQQQQSLQFSRLFLQGTASFSSLSSALNSAMDSGERLVEELEAFINIRNLRGSRQESSRVINGGSFDSFSSIISVNHPGTEMLDTAPGTSSTPLPRVADSAGMEANQTTDIEVNSTVPPFASSSTRRTDDLDEGESHRRRRRLC